MQSALLQAVMDELRCPMCDYSLRGLSEPRCPECGFSFTWEELRTAAREKHPYLFEHQNKRNIWSLWMTYWGDCRPRRFWTRLSPANPVRVRRLLLYWLLANALIFINLVNPLIGSAVHTWQSSAALAASYKLSPDGTRYDYVGTITIGWTPQMALTIPEFDNYFPRLLSLAFARQVFNNSQYPPSILGAIGIFLAWPWLTYLTLLIFQTSMKRAKTREIHVLRCAIYGCDFGFLLILALVFAWEESFRNLWVCTFLTCVIVATYRLTIAYKRYIRFDHPFLTILASQAIVFMAVFIVILNFTNYWGEWI